MIAVADPDDPRLVRFGLDDRRLRENGCFLAEGDLVVERALAAGCRAIAVLVDPDRVPPVAATLGADVFAGGRDVREAVTRLGVVQPIIALFARPPEMRLDEFGEQAQRLVVVEAVDNPANLGAIVRSAAAFAWDGLVVDATSADPLSRRALRVAMGTTFAVPHVRTADVAATLADLAGRGFDTIGLTPDPEATDVATLGASGRRAVVIGAERAGLSPAARAACRRLVRIPMAPGVDSLNAGAAAAIACYVLGRSRSCPG